MANHRGFGLRPRRISELLDLPYRVYRERIALFVALGIALSVAQQTVGLVWQWWMFGSLDQQSPPADPLAALAGLAVGLPAVLVANAVLVAFFTLPMIGAARDAMTGDSRPWASLLRDAWSRAPAAAVCASLFAFVWMAGFMMCILPGLFVGVAFSLATSLTYLERRGPLRAFSRSWTLVFGRGGVRPSTEANWVRVLLIGLVTVVVWYALSILSSLPVVVAQWATLARGGQMVMTALGPQPLPLPLMLPLYFVGAVLGGVFLPLAVTPWPILYLDIRARHEGLDLEHAIVRLEHEESLA